MNHFGRFALLGIWLTLGERAVAAEPRAVLPVDGSAYQAELIAAEPSWKLKLKPVPPAEGDVRSTSAADLVRWGAPAEIGTSPAIFFVDGGSLAINLKRFLDSSEGGEVLKLEKDRLAVESPLLGRLSIPFELVRGFVFQPPADRTQRDRLAARLFEPSDADGDRLILENGDELSGDVTALTEKRIQLESEGKPLEIPTTRVAAIAFNPSLLAKLPASGLRAIVGLSDGSRFIVPKLLLDEKQVRFMPLYAADSDAAAWTTDADRLVFLQPLGGKATYLSDLPVESYRHIPYLNISWPYRLDRNVTGTTLRASGRLYAKGVGMHSAARLTFRLDKPYRRFDAYLAIDDQAAGHGSVTFRVFADRDQKFASDTIRGGQPPVPVSIDVSGARQISLVVDFGERAEELDHADWLDARLTP
jgi:NPCBM/NEW2 domain-containing protein